MNISEPHFKHLKHWITEREHVRVAREEGKRKPWADNPIIRNYRFCNARRMDDKVSRWLRDSWYDDTQDAQTLLIAAALARMINWPESLSLITKGEKFTLDYWDPRRI